jgi:predicted dienelactone hydrolase
MTPLILLGALLAAQSPFPTPDGSYAVGVRRFELVDASRKGVAEDAPDQLRALPEIIWYPAEATGAPPAPYFTQAEAAVEVPALARNFLFDAAEVAGFAAVRTHALADAPVLHSHGRFPIVLFSHGYWLYPNQNEPLAEELASHGYIVVSIAHPRDAVDLRMGDGRIVATNPRSEANKALFAVVGKLFSGKTHDARVAMLDQYKAIFPGSRMAVSLDAWRDDTLFTLRSMRDGQVPEAVRAILSSADQDKVALAGMSFGGTTAATTCRLVAQCRAIINLDGENWEPALFDGDVERPMLLMQSDWTRHRLVPEQPADPAFTPYDYAFERWTEAGTTGRVLRVRIEGTTHMGLTDLALLMPGLKAAERFGEADPAHVAHVIDTLSLAFLDWQFGRGGKAALDQRVDHMPGLVRHDPAQTRRWALARGKH